VLKIVFELYTGSHHSFVSYSNMVVFTGGSPIATATTTSWTTSKSTSHSSTHTHTPGKTNMTCVHCMSICHPIMTQVVENHVFVCG